MAFASLEEAWGVPSLEGPGGAAVDLRHERQPPGQPPGQPPERTPFARMARPRAAPDDGDLLAPADLAPPAPARDADADLAGARRLLEATYDRYGLPGLLRLLPRRATSALRRKCRRGGGGVWRGIRRLLSSADAVLVVLVAAFVALALWDTRAAPAVPPLTSLHMSPFPLGTSS
jgi:hypothetical protein